MFPGLIIPVLSQVFMDDVLVGGNKDYFIGIIIFLCGAVLTQAVPEIDDAKELPGDISGEIEINNVTFAYSEDAPNALNGLNLNIKSGEYVGIVGSSGCGKSTLLKCYQLR